MVLMMPCWSDMSAASRARVNGASDVGALDDFRRVNESDRALGLGGWAGLEKCPSSLISRSSSFSDRREAPAGRRDFFFVNESDRSIAGLGTRHCEAQGHDGAAREKEILPTAPMSPTLVRRPPAAAEEPLLAARLLPAA